MQERTNSGPLRPIARRLRRDQTRAEALLWSRLRNRRLNGYKFHRQYALERYIVDFVCREHRLVVEVDGGQHGRDNAADAVRSAWLGERGFRVLRFWNNEVMENLEGVLTTIAAALGTAAPNPLPPGEGASGASG